MYAGYRESIGYKWTDIAPTVILTFEFTYVTITNKRELWIEVTQNLLFLFLSEIKLQLPFSLKYTFDDIFKSISRNQVWFSKTLYLYMYLTIYRKESLCSYHVKGWLYDSKSWELPIPFHLCWRYLTMFWNFYFNITETNNVLVRDVSRIRYKYKFNLLFEK